MAKKKETTPKTKQEEKKQSGETKERDDKPTEESKKEVVTVPKKTGFKWGFEFQVIKEGLPKCVKIEVETEKESEKEAFTNALRKMEIEYKNCSYHYIQKFNKEAIN